jgi:hypothetical protein
LYARKALKEMFCKRQGGADGKVSRGVIRELEYALTVKI